MRNIFLGAFLALFLFGCEQAQVNTEPGQEMDGPETIMRYPAFNEMCQREPDSTLCNAEDQ